MHHENRSSRSLRPVFHAGLPDVLPFPSSPSSGYRWRYSLTFGLLLAGNAQAFGLNTPDVAVHGLGQAHAGSAAGTETAASQFANPAALAGFAAPADAGAGTGIRMTLGGQWVQPEVQFHDARDAARNTSVTPASGQNHLALALPLGEKLVAGLSLSGPEDWRTEYRDAPWDGTPRPLSARVSSHAVRPALAWQVNEALRVGASLTFRHLDMETLNRSSASRIDRYQGSGDAVGWQVGFQYQLSPAMRVGLNYDAPMRVRLSGSQTRSGNTLPADSTVQLPDRLTWSVQQQVSEQWEAMGDLSYTRWEQLDRIEVTDQSGQQTPERLNLRNSWRAAWGAAYKADEQLRLRFGFAYETSPLRPGQVHPYLPLGDRYTLALGLTCWPWPKTRLDAGYSWQWSRRLAGSHQGNQGSQQGTYDRGAHVLGLSLSQTF